MSVFADDFGFFCKDERLNFDFLILFSFFEKIENAFISEFLQEKSLKGDVVDFPLIMDSAVYPDLRFAAQNEGLYFYDRQEKNADSCFGFNSDYFSYADFDNSVKNFHHRALNGFFNDNPHYVFDYDCSYSERHQSFNSRNDFKGENYQGKYKTDVSYNRKKEISRHIYESGRGILGSITCSVSPSDFSTYSESVSYNCEAVCFWEKNFDEEERNAVFAFAGREGYFSDDGNFFSYNTNCFSDDGNYFVESGRYFYNKLAADKAFEQFGAACRVNKASAFDMLVQSVGKFFFDKAELFSQSKKRFASSIENQFVQDEKAFFFNRGNLFLQGENGFVFNRGNLFTVNRVKELALKRVNQSVKLMYKVFMGKSKNFAACEFWQDKKRLAQGYEFALCQGNFYAVDIGLLQAENAFEKSLYLRSIEPGELHISFDDLKKAIGTGALEYCGKPVKAEVKVDMSGMKNIIYKETSIDSIVTDLTAAVSEAVTAAAEGVHIL